jgi:hypothetical protein
MGTVCARKGYGVIDNSIPGPQHGFVSGNDYLLLPAYSKPWVVRGVVPAGGAVNIYGKPKLGKSYCALGLALAVANDHVTSWMGFPVEHHGKVAYFQIDTPRNSWQERLKKIQATEPHLSLDNLFIADKGKIPSPFDITNPGHRDWLRDQLKALNPVLVIIDVMREVHAVDENDSTAMKKVAVQLFEATTPYATILVSHARKDQPLMGEDLMSDNRGSNYLAGRMDVVAKLTRKEFHVQGRDTEFTTLPVMQRKQDGMVVFDLPPGENQDKSGARTKALNDLLRATRGMKLPERARLIAPVVGMSPDATRKMIQAFLKDHPGYDDIQALTTFEDTLTDDTDDTD